MTRRGWWTLLQLGPYLILSGALIVGAGVNPGPLAMIIIGVGLLAIGWIHTAICVAMYVSGYWRGRVFSSFTTEVDPRPWDPYIDPRRTPGDE